MIKVPCGYYECYKHSFILRKFKNSLFLNFLIHISITLGKTYLSNSYGLHNAIIDSIIDVLLSINLLFLPELARH